MVSISGIVAPYQFGTLSDAILRIGKWVETGHVDEKDVARFIIQLFHEIPEPLYNDIINEL